MVAGGRAARSAHPSSITIGLRSIVRATDAAISLDPLDSVSRPLRSDPSADAAALPTAATAASPSALALADLPAFLAGFPSSSPAGAAAPSAVLSPPSAAAAFLASSPAALEASAAGLSFFLAGLSFSGTDFSPAIFSPAGGAAAFSPAAFSVAADPAMGAAVGVEFESAFFFSGGGSLGCAGFSAAAASVAAACFFAALGLAGFSDESAEVEEACCGWVVAAGCSALLLLLGSDDWSSVAGCSADGFFAEAMSAFFVSFLGAGTGAGDSVAVAAALLSDSCAFTSAFFSFGFSDPSMASAGSFFFLISFFAGGSAAGVVSAA